MTDVSIDELARRLDEVASGALTLLDVRTPEEYTGTGGQPCDPRQGHVPGARNLDVYRLLALPEDELRAELDLPDRAEIIAYCHSGGRSGMAVEALRLLGYDARNYVGSWHEWSRRDELPLER